MAAIIKENLEAIGVNSEIASYDSATYFSVVMDESNFDIALFYLSSPARLGCDIISAYLEFIPLGWHDEARDQYGVLCDNIKHTLDMNQCSIRICTGTESGKPETTHNENIPAGPLARGDVLLLAYASTVIRLPTRSTPVTLPVMTVSRPIMSVRMILSSTSLRLLTYSQTCFSSPPTI